MSNHSTWESGTLGLIVIRETRATPPMEGRIDVEKTICGRREELAKSRGAEDPKKVKAKKHSKKMLTVELPQRRSQGPEVGVDVRSNSAHQVRSRAWRLVDPEGFLEETVGGTQFVNEAFPID